MATTVINPAPAKESSDNGIGFLLGIILIIAFIALLFYFGLPFVQQGFSGGTPQINVPDKVDVNVQNAK